ncbi:MAG: carotenoid oxygenase family protein [Deltaproteobacteria bacterium]|nr:carotenoid oxygenase family protein [Deltaproteobacteria bacterium]MBW2393310.1 carotenoid oxygenase family protein [Deltaproteobacteria bacterium]
MSSAPSTSNNSFLQGPPPPVSEKHDDIELLVLDARDLESGPEARVPIPHRVPIGFHANWLPECG